MMKKKTWLCVALLLLAVEVSAAKGGDVMARIDGKPALLLAGELGNSSAACKEDIDRIFPHLKAIGLNTVLVPAYWDLIEAEEGQFDFTLTDYVLRTARENELHVVFLWFGAWKNSMSCYAPAWFKTDSDRFPRALTESGKPMEIASAFSENVYQADRKAFTSWLKHVVENDREYGTVVMIQIENEIGMLESARDHSDVANREYEKWQKANKVKDTTEEAKRENEERFMAVHYARYVERMAKEARKLTDIPLYVNAALNSRGRKPGEYPSAGPLAHLRDVWQRYAPTIDFMSPDIYDSGYKGWVSQYAFAGNTLFIPEIRRDENCGAKAFYAFGEKDAIGFSPFSIEDSPKDTKLKAAYDCLRQLSSYIIKYRGTEAMSGILFDQADRDTTIVMRECLRGRDGLSAKTGSMRVRCAHYFTLPWDSRATDGSVWPEGGGIIIRLAPMEYLVAGSGIVVTFENDGEAGRETQLGEDGFVLGGEKRGAGVEKRESGIGCRVSGVGRREAGGENREARIGCRVSDGENREAGGEKRIGILSCDQVVIAADGGLRYVRRLNGDQDHQGRHVRIGVDDYQILHVKLYEY